MHKRTNDRRNKTQVNGSQAKQNTGEQKSGEQPTGETTPRRTKTQAKQATSEQTTSEPNPKRNNKQANNKRGKQNPSEQQHTWRALAIKPPSQAWSLSSSREDHVWFGRLDFLPPVQGVTIEAREGGLVKRGEGGEKGEERKR